MHVLLNKSLYNIGVSPATAENREITDFWKHPR